MSGTSAPNPKSNAQLTLTSVLLGITVLSIWLAFCVAFETPPTGIVLLTTLLALRILIVFRARPVLFSLPILLLVLAMPIFTEWGLIRSAWFSTRRPDPPSDWISWFFIYPILPVATWFVDIRMNYDSVQIKIIRLVIELIVFYLWIAIFVGILIDMGSSHS